VHRVRAIALCEHTELTGCSRRDALGELERQTQFKDKAQRQESVPLGLLAYLSCRRPTCCCIKLASSGG